MSSTGRSDARQADDHYVTPAWCVDALLQAIPPIGDVAIVDPCCGEGAILEALKGRHNADPSRYMGIELDAARAKVAEQHHFHVLRGDFLKVWPKVKNADAVIMNPPYSLAREFVQAAIGMVNPATGWRPGSFVAALLRLAFLESQKRREWWQQHPADVLVLSKRPSFTGGGTDSTAYAWFLWGPGPRGRIAVL